MNDLSAVLGEGFAGLVGHFVSVDPVTGTVGSLVEKLGRDLGRDQVLSDPDVVAGFAVDWTGRWKGKASAVVRPGSTAEVVTVVNVCREVGVAVIPQGGNTGLVGGSVPAADDGAGDPSGARPAVIVSLVRLDHLGEVDVASGQVTVGAGATLAGLQRHLVASATGLRFGVDLGSRDSATIGGMVATNAGGIHVVRHGAMRRQVIGLEAVLPNGEVLSRMQGLAKDNSGYDLPGLLTGSEGTLGVVTAVRLTLVATPPFGVTAMVGLESTAAVVDVVTALRRDVASLEAAEIFYQDGLDLVCRYAALPPPLSDAWGAYLLVDCAARDEAVLEQLAQSLAALGVEDDATALAIDGPARRRLWAVRERHTEAVNWLGVPHKLDVSLPLSAWPAFVPAVRGVVAQVRRDAAVILWGHAGDGNLHVNVIGPVPDDIAVDDAVLRLVADMGGSISAEHGIGRAKVPWLHLTRSDGDIAAMRAIKRAWDPAGLMNPGVLLPPP